MSNKQQTAVEWFAERIQSDKIFNFENVLKQAKEMEKEQIKKAWADGDYNTDDDGNPLENYSISDEHYYEQKYGGN